MTDTTPTEEYTYDPFTEALEFFVPEGSSEGAREAFSNGWQASKIYVFLTTRALLREKGFTAEELLRELDLELADYDEANEDVAL